MLPKKWNEAVSVAVWWNTQHCCAWWADGSSVYPWGSRIQRLSSFFSFLLLFCSFRFFLSSSKSQLLNNVAVAVAGDGTQNPV